MDFKRNESSSSSLHPARRFSFAAAAAAFAARDETIASPPPPGWTTRAIYTPHPLFLPLSGGGGGRRRGETSGDKLEKVPGGLPRALPLLLARALLQHLQHHQTLLSRARQFVKMFSTPNGARDAGEGGGGTKWQSFIFSKKVFLKK